MKIIRRKGRNPLAEASAEPLSLEGEIEYCKLDSNRLQQIISRHGLQPTWERFARQFLTDPE